MRSYLLSVPAVFVWGFWLKPKTEGVMIMKKQTNEYSFYNFIIIILLLVLVIKLV